MIDKLLDNYESSKGHREAIITEHKAYLEKIDNKLSELLSQFVEGMFDKEKVELKHRQLQDEKEYHQSVIDEQLALTEDSRLDELMASLKELDNLFDWGLMDATPEQKKEIISKVLHEFVIYQDRIELRYKVPVTSKQVAECVQVSRQM